MGGWATGFEPAIFAATEQRFKPLSYAHHNIRNIIRKVKILLFFLKLNR